jgi:hypothetical protein
LDIVFKQVLFEGNSKSGYVAGFIQSSFGFIFIRRFVQAGSGFCRVVTGRRGANVRNDFMFLI